MFGFQFDKTEVCVISNVNFNHEELIGTCKLISQSNPTDSVTYSSPGTYTPSRGYTMTWSIQNYPMETAGMPGSPYSIQVDWAINSKSGSNDHTHNAISGQFIYSVNSGTFPNFSELGIRFGEYLSIGLNLKSYDKTKVLIKLNESEPSYVYLFN